jgi:hypothetical protein
MALGPPAFANCVDAMWRWKRGVWSIGLTSYARWKSSVLSSVTYLSLVGSVSLYDIVLTILYAPYLKHAEQNPVGRWLMGLDHLKLGELPDLTLFLTLKSIGTVFVLATMHCLILWRSQLGHPVALGVSLCQLVLAAYLTFGTTAF